MQRPGSQQQQGYGSAPPANQGNKPGMSTAMKLGLGAVGGLAAGALAEHEIHKFENWEDRREEKAYNDGVADGRDEDFGGGPRFGGGFGGNGFEERQETITQVDTYDGPDGDYTETTTETFTDYQDDSGW